MGWLLQSLGSEYELWEARYSTIARVLEEFMEEKKQQRASSVSSQIIYTSVIHVEYSLIPNRNKKVCVSKEMAEVEVCTKIGRLR